MDVSNNPDPVKAIARHEARKSGVQYGDPVILHESSKQRITFVPFFIARSDGTDLSVKIQTYRKMDPPQEWVLVDDKSVSMNEAAARKLHLALKDHLAVADETDGAGAYLLVRLDEGTAQLSAHDPSTVAEALTKILGQPEIAKHLNHTELSTALIGAMRGAIRLQEMSEAVAQLRSHLESGDASESTYQTWCEAHSWAFGNAYVVRDAVRTVAAGDRLDILLPTVMSGYRDLVELKRPDMDVLIWDSVHRNYYFSSELSKAVGQCHRYLDVLGEVAKVGLQDHPEIVAYHPRAIIVIGRSIDWPAEQQKALHGLNARLSGITVMTYDHLLNQGERLVQMLGSAAAGDGDHEAAGQDEPDDDFPF